MRFKKTFTLSLILLTIILANSCTQNKSDAPNEADFQSPALILSPPIEDIAFDYHENYGTVGIEEYPYGDPSMDVMQKLAPVIQGFDVQNIDIRSSVFSGPALTEHLDGGQTFNVWHDYVDTPVYEITVSYFLDGNLEEEELLLRGPCFNWLGGWLTPIGNLLERIFCC